MASKRRLRRKACDGKRRFESAADAITAIGRLKACTGTTSRFNAYRCQFCHGFHYGHAPGSNRFMGRHAHG